MSDKIDRIIPTRPEAFTGAYPALLVRIRASIPGFRIYSVDKDLTVAQVCERAQEYAVAMDTSVYLVLDEERSLHFGGRGSWQIVSPPRGLMKPTGEALPAIGRPTARDVYSEFKFSDELLGIMHPERYAQ